MNLSDRQLIRILLFAVVLLALGELFFFAGGSRGNLAVPPGALAPAGGNAAPSVSEIPVANALPTALSAVSGTVVSVGAASLVVSTAGGNETISASSNTTIVKEGAPKSASQQESELKTFHDEYVALMKDPRKNADALQNLIAPSPNQETAISLSAIGAGDRVSAIGHQGSGSFSAVKLSLIAQAAN